MGRRAAVGVDDDLAPGEAGVALRAAGDEAAGGVDVDLGGVRVIELCREDRLDDDVSDSLADLAVLDVIVVLSGDDDRLDAHRLVSIILDSHLGLPVRP